MSPVPERSPTGMVTCHKCGRQNPAGRFECYNCRQPLAAWPPPGPGLNDSPSQPAEPDPLELSLQESRSENEELRRQIDSMRLELGNLKSAGAKPLHSPSLLAELQDKLKAAEQEVASWASHASGLESKRKAAEETAASLEGKLVNKVKEVEELLKNKAGTKPTSRFKVISGIIALLGSMGGYGTGHYMASPDDSSRVKQLSAELTAAQQQIASGGQTTAAQDQLQTQLKQLQTKLNDALAAQHSAEVSLGQAQASNASLRPLLRARDEQIASLKAQLAPNGVLIWTGNLSGKRTIDITNGEPTFGSLKGALPRRSCKVSTQNSHVKIKTRPSEKNRWSDLSFEVSGNGLIEVRIDWEAL